MVFIPRLGRSSGGHGKPLQYSCLENSMIRGAWRARVHEGTNSQTQLKQLSTHTGTSPCLKQMFGAKKQELEWEVWERKSANCHHLGESHDHLKCQDNLAIKIRRTFSKRQDLRSAYKN